MKRQVNEHDHATFVLVIQIPNITYQVLRPSIIYDNAKQQDSKRFDECAQSHHLLVPSSWGIFIFLKRCTTF